MRVIAGQARGRPLRTLPGQVVRPTADKIRAAIFSMLESWLAATTGLPLDPTIIWQGRRVLDLYAGTGAVGIEALSRGAAWAEFVEANPAACRVLRQNLETVGFATRARLHCAPVQQVLGQPDRLSGPYDVIFLDPPYGDPSLPVVLERIIRLGLLKPDGLLVIEHAREQPLPPRLDGLVCIRERRYGRTMVSIYTALPEGA
jgi:16S rRNA (guanine966-N2)-methyltransferase